MKKTFASICLFSMMGAAAQACPTLPANSGLEWTYKEGPDFGVCYALPPNTQKAAFGIYLGDFSHFRERKEDRLGKGHIGGMRVTWYKKNSDDAELPVARETQIRLDKPYGSVAHVWVFAEDEATMQARLAILEHIVFE